MTEPVSVAASAPLDLDDPAAARVGAPPIERPRPDGGLDLGQLETAQLGGRDRHGQKT
jgi:hypothetical protein